MNMLPRYLIILNTRCQAENALHYIRTHYKNELTGLILPQATSTRRTQLTAIGQLRWYLTQEAGFNFLDRCNTYDGSGVNYDDLKEYFVFCFDERGDQGKQWLGALYVP